MDTQLVRVLKSLNPFDYEEMALNKVPKSYVLVAIPEYGGDFYTDIRLIPRDHTPKHPEFSPEVRAELVRLFDTFKGALPVGIERLERNFLASRPGRGLP